ncbi:hypothetical protein [Mycobacteroides abscessus]|uniref:hypothetical protein n=1 Tax=Mycobacteroides abscessus TaxID=36809 RepID=UPI001F348205|nr:hypothetical protein [Mycobacteroides abscessus]
MLGPVEMALGLLVAGLLVSPVPRERPARRVGLGARRLVRDLLVVRKARGLCPTCQG